MEAKRFAVISRETGEVVNVVLWAGAEFLPPRGHYVVQADVCDIGDTFDFDKNVIVRADRTAK